MVETVFDRDRRIRNAALTMGQTFYLCTLNQFIGKNADAWPSQSAIAWAMNATARAVRKWQTELEALNVIQVDIGKGRYSTNRYRLNLDALALKEEPRSALSDDSSIQCGTQFLPNEEHSSSAIRNHVPTERTVKEHLKEQAFSFPEKLNTTAFSSTWAEWVTHRQELKKKLTPSTVSKQLAKLAAWGPTKAIQAIENSISNGWSGLFDPDGRRSGNGATSNPEAEQAWQTVLDSLKAHSRFNPQRIMADVGQHAWQALRGVGLKKLDEANDFDRRELKTKFIQAFEQQEAAA